MKLFFNDAETYSSVRIERGLDQYLTGVEPLIWTYCDETSLVECWDIASGARMPSRFEDNMLDERVKKVAQNAQFDRAVANAAFGWASPPSQWHCTMAQAYAHALPGSMEMLGPVMGLPEDMQKLASGKKLIQLFCVPHKGKPRATAQTHPVEWQQFIDYGVQDTAALRELYKRLPKYNYQGEHYDLWVLDQEINQRGFSIDLPLCEQAVKICDTLKEKLNAEVEALTDGAITAATQRQRVLNHMVGEYGFMMLDLTSDTIKTMLKEDKTLTPDARRLLEIRLESAMTSQAKYKRALERVGPDGRMRYTLQYAGAGRTGRWAGRGFQPHNMPRPKREADETENEIIPAILDGTLPQKVNDINQACADAIRGAIIAAPGCELLVGDWSNIEGVCLAWEAKAESKLKAFRANYSDPDNNPDIYVHGYSESFGVPAASVDGKQRQMGKGLELSMGYGGGVGAFINVAASYGLDLDELGRVVPGIVPAEVYNKADKAWQRAFIRGEDLGLEPDVYIACDALKQVYRKANSEIVQMWWDVERAVKWAIERRGSVHHVARCKIWCTTAWLVIELPSGRRLLYAQPEVKRYVEYDEEKGQINERKVIRYMAAKAKQWRMDRTYGGKIAENITQAIANDVLRAAMLRVDAEGYQQVLHVHDEIVAEGLIGLFDINAFLALMEEPLPWAPDLPLKAAGYVATRYRKE